MVAGSAGAGPPAGRTDSRARPKASSAHWKSPDRAASRPRENSCRARESAACSGETGAVALFLPLAEAQLPAPRITAAASPTRAQLFPFVRGRDRSIVKKVKPARTSKQRLFSMRSVRERGHDPVWILGFRFWIRDPVRRDSYLPDML